MRLQNHTVLATEFKPALNWLGHRLTEYHESRQVMNVDEDGMILDDKENEIDNDDDDDEIEDW